MARTYVPGSVGRSQFYVPSPSEEEETFFLNNGIKLLVWTGDITKMAAASVVVGEDDLFSGRGKAARALIEAGGTSYRLFRDQLKAHAKKEGCRESVYCCPAGDLDFTYVFHAIIKHGRNAIPFWDSHLKNLFFQVGVLAEKFEAATMATPLLGSGNAGGSMEISLQAAVDGLSCVSPKHLHKVILVEFNAKKASSIQEKLKQILSEAEPARKEQNEASGGGRIQGSDPFQSWGSSVSGDAEQDQSSSSGPSRQQGWSEGSGKSGREAVTRSTSRDDAEHDRPSSSGPVNPPCSGPPGGRGPSYGSKAGPCRGYPRGIVEDRKKVFNDLTLKQSSTIIFIKETIQAQDSAAKTGNRESQYHHSSAVKGELAETSVQVSACRGRGRGREYANPSKLPAGSDSDDANSQRQPSPGVEDSIANLRSRSTAAESSDEAGSTGDINREEGQTVQKSTDISVTGHDETHSGSCGGHRGYSGTRGSDVGGGGADTYGESPYDDNVNQRGKRVGDADGNYISNIPVRPPSWIFTSDESGEPGRDETKVGAGNFGMTLDEDTGGDADKPADQFVSSGNGNDFPRTSFDSSRPGIEGGDDGEIGTGASSGTEDFNAGLWGDAKDEENASSKGTREGHLHPGTSSGKRRQSASSASPPRCRDEGRPLESQPPHATPVAIVYPGEESEGDSEDEKAGSLVDKAKGSTLTSAPARGEDNTWSGSLDGEASQDEVTAQERGTSSSVSVEDTEPVVYFPPTTFDLQDSCPTVTWSSSNLPREESDPSFNKGVSFPFPSVPSGQTRSSEWWQHQDLPLAERREETTYTPAEEDGSQRRGNTIEEGEVSEKFQLSTVTADRPDVAEMTHTEDHSRQTPTSSRDPQEERPESNAMANKMSRHPPNAMTNTMSRHSPNEGVNFEGNDTFSWSNADSAGSSHGGDVEAQSRTGRSTQGSMPGGKMLRSSKDHLHLDGFPDCGTILVEYSFPNGTQGPEHPAPGEPYKGTFRRAFLPDNPEGQRVCSLLQKAFDRKLTFEIVQRGASQEWVVDFAAIPHKTSLRGGREGNGYPDLNYLPEVLRVLGAHGLE